MGYYSSVAIEITKDEEAKFLEIIEDHKSPDDYQVPNHAKTALEWADRMEMKDWLWDKGFRSRNQIDAVIYYWDEVKWYYDGPEFIEKAMKQLDNYHFCRVGEEIGDCEEQYDGYLDGTLINVHSYINIGG